MSERAEIAKGQELHEDMLKEMPVYADAELQAYVNTIGQKLAVNSHRSELKYTFTIIDSPEINAFALPGGYIYINRGLMSYLNSEAQLAAVLSHEIGHVTARHSVRQKTASQTAGVLSTVLVVATGVAAVQEATSLLEGALLSGYGRDMELEADSLGAEYLFNSGYEPNAMVEVITVLKNHEDFTKRTSNRGVTYHGLFASHPRNDVRLKEMVGKAGTLSKHQHSEVDPDVFRNQLDSLLLGPSIQTAVGNSANRNRYYQNLLSYTVVFPKNWLTKETTTTVNAESSDDSSSITISVRRLQQSISPRSFITENLGITNLQRTEALSQFGLNGYTGINPTNDQRIAVIYYGPRAYIFTTTNGVSSSANNDELIMASIKSFRPIANNEQAFANPIKLKYIRSDGKTYTELAKTSRLKQPAEDLLRLYNGDYPNADPITGEWIKIAK